MKFFLEFRVIEAKFKEFISKVKNKGFALELKELHHFALDPFVIVCVCEDESIEKLDKKLDELREYAEIEEVAGVLDTPEAETELQEFIG